MDKELQRRLQTVARQLNGREVSGGAGVDVAVKASSKDGTLVAVVGEMTFRLSNFALVPKDFGKPPYKAFDESSRVRRYFYSSDIEWRYGKIRDGRKDIVLGCWESRKKLHSKMTPHQQAVADSLLSLVDKVIAGRYGVEFLGPRIQVKREEYPEDVFGEARSF